MIITRLAYYDDQDPEMPGQSEQIARLAMLDAITPYCKWELSCAFGPTNTARKVWYLVMDQCSYWEERMGF